MCFICYCYTEPLVQYQADRIPNAPWGSAFVGLLYAYFYFLPRRDSTLGKTACLLYLSCIQLVMPFRGHRITGNYWLCHLRYFTIRKCSKWFTAIGKWYPMCLGFELLGGFLGTSCPQWQGCWIQLLKNTKPYLLLAYKRFQPSENQQFETFVSTTECALDLESKLFKPKSNSRLHYSRHSWEQ